MVLDTARRVLEIESLAVKAMIDRLDGAFERAVDMILACDGRVIVTGMGKSGLICQKIAATFSSTGIPSYFLHPAEAVHGDLGILVQGDLTLAVSNSGETEELVRLVELIRRVGAGIISMTGSASSTLAERSDVHLHVGVDQEACSLDLVPTASTTAALAMGDALVVACYEKRGFTARDFARYHPGGRLGRKLIQVGDLMRRNADTPVVKLDTPMPEAISEMTNKSLGMTCVVDDDGKLAGVLTDGDLRRLIMSSPSPLQGIVADAMTTDPVTITSDALATEALRILESKKITSLPVLDAERLVLGVIQIHDLWRTELF